MIVRIVLSAIIILFLYYSGLFIYYYRKTKKVKLALKNTLILLLPLIAFLFIVEFGFRVIVSNKVMHSDGRFFTRNFATAYYFIYAYKLRPVRYIRLRECETNESSSYRPPQGYLAKCENLRDTIYSQRVDKDGFVSPVYEGKHKIFFVGGSTTECHFVQEYNRFAYLTGKMLSERGISSASHNAGFSGNHTMHSVNNIINKILQYKPEVIVYMEAINDLSILFFEGSYYNQNPTRSLIVTKNAEESRMDIEKRMDEFHFYRNKKTHVDTAVIFDEYKAAIKLLLDVCKSKGVQPVLMTQFNRIIPSQKDKCKQLQELLETADKAVSGTDYIALYRRMNNIIRETAVNEAVPLIDLDLLVPKSTRYMYDAVHLNDSGSLLVSTIVSEHLAKILTTQTVN